MELVFSSYFSQIISFPTIVFSTKQSSSEMGVADNKTKKIITNFCVLKPQEGDEYQSHLTIAKNIKKEMFMSEKS